MTNKANAKRKLMAFSKNKSIRLDIVIVYCTQIIILPGQPILFLYGGKVLNHK
jgi:hypothetical protein